MLLAVVGGLAGYLLLSVLTPGTPAEVTADPDSLLGPVVPEPVSNGPDSLLGLLALPGLDEQVIPAPVTVRVHALPSEGSALIAETSAPDSLDQLEVSYETPAMTVWRRNGDWYGVKLKDGRPGWIATPQGATFHSLAELIDDSFTYLAEAWDGKLYPEADLLARPVDIPTARDTTGEPVVDVREVRQIDGRLWVRLVLYDQSPCEGDEPKELLEAWVPAWTRAQPTVWFYSRGC